ncbi:unnamed protein product [Adineta steineri]|uniref:Uncharacterized protein n=1 Tax=Adineta steineri TaxID=433720 RepID=A0A818UBP4_9BILA|nr:unnamed protein product [Adineta steineri]CAF1273102.1 unnamed protein product [Adineta steineri]CAF3494259.1 unnamed protein product [Adineta steineri]CAF3696164.1 unnamed protein product [Adineta steineri]
MSGRTPSFIVVGLVIIMFLLGIFYMSCSSKNSELRSSVEQFEDRIRSLTLKNSDLDKKIESINSRKHELEEEKLNIQKQMEKKDSEINDLNTKLNEKIADLQSLKTDKNILDEQLKEYKSMNKTLVSKDSLIQQLQQQLYDQKQTGNDAINRLKQEYETLKNSRQSRDTQVPSNNEQQNNFANPPERFRPFISNNLTTKSTASLFDNSLNKLNNLTNEVKEKIIPAALDVKDKVLDAVGLNTKSSTTTIANEQQQQIPIHNRYNQEVGGNVPMPPLNNDTRQSAQSASKFSDNHDQDQGVADNLRYQQRSQRSLNNLLSDNKTVKLSDNEENDDEEEQNVNLDNIRVREHKKSPEDSVKRNDLENVDDDEPVHDSPSVALKNNNYRIGDREQVRENRGSIQRDQRVDNGEEVENDDENDIQSVQKRNVS